MVKKINQTFTIPEEHANERLDQALAKLLSDFSRTQIKTWIENNQVTVNGQRCKSKLRLKGGELVNIEADLIPQLSWEAQNLPLEIIYEDEALLIINKPIGLVVHPGAGNKDKTLLNALLYHIPALRDLPRAGILHRLDKDTSGLLMVAKTPGALKKLGHQLKKRTVLREYQAVVYGKIISGGTIDAPMSRHPMQRKKMAVSTAEIAKPAITHYRVLEKYPAHTRLKIQLETGRTHQIRVHMAHIHHPVVGDSTYARLQLTKNITPELAQFLRQFKRQALHAYVLGLTHPTTGELMRFEIDLPDDLKQFISILKQDRDRK